MSHICIITYLPSSMEILNPQVLSIDAESSSLTRPQGNVLIDDEGHARICDFGLCSIFLEDGHSGMTTTSEHTGTERYLAPELITSHYSRPMAASDVYALGCIGLEVRSFYSFPMIESYNISLDSLFATTIW